MNQAPFDLAAIPRGTILDGRFEVRERLGMGSFGAVYRAHQLVFDRPLREVALKLFHSENVTPENVEDVFQDAITLFGMQQHNPDPEIQRHLVELYDLGVLSNGQAFMSLKYVPGGQTFEALAQRRVDFGMRVELSLEYLEQLLRPLAWMHTLNPPLVHGDLKPDNVLLHADRLILTDFGLAARMPKGVRGGAISYQAAETLAGEPGGPPSDIFAVGIMWYEMLTRRHPFAHVGLEQRAQGDDTGYANAHLESRRWPIRRRLPHEQEDTPVVVPASEWNDDFRKHPQLEAMLNKCLDRRPSRRYLNARILLDEIRRYRSNDVDRANLAHGHPTEQQASTSIPDNQTQCHKLALNMNSLVDQGRFEEAEVVSQELQTVFPGMSLTYLTIARFRLKQGHFDLALKSCQQAHEIEPNSHAASTVLADIYEAMGKVQLAASLRRRRSR